MHRKRGVSAGITWSAIGVRHRARAASSCRPSPETGAGCIPAHGELGIELVFAGVVGVVLLLVGVWHVAHAFHVGEFAVRCTSVAHSASLRLDRPLGVNILVPITHGIFIGITNDKIVDHAGISFPEYLDSVKPYSNELDFECFGHNAEDQYSPGF